MATARPPTNKAPILVSYHYMREWKEEQIDYVLSNPNAEILLDSGAFSALNTGAEVKLEDYIAFLHRWGDKLFGYMLLDKLGDPGVTASNLAAMLDAGLQPIPIHVRGDSQERMDYLFTVSDYVAMGGFRRPKVGWSGKGYVKLKMSWAAGRPVHWLGYTRQDMLPTFRPYSCDSANIMSGAMYGLLMVFDRGRIKQYNYKDIVKMQQPTVALQRALNAVGATWANLKDARAWRAKTKSGARFVEHLPHLLTCYCYSRYAKHASESWGTRVFMATTNVYDTIEIIYNIWNQWAPERYSVPDRVSEPPRSVGQYYVDG